MTKAEILLFSLPRSLPCPFLASAPTSASDLVQKIGPGSSVREDANGARHHRDEVSAGKRKT